MEVPFQTTFWPEVLQHNLNGVHTYIDIVSFPVTEEYNRRNIFDGAEMRLGFAVREPIMRGIFAATHTQGTASRQAPAL